MSDSERSVCSSRLQASVYARLQRSRTHAPRMRSSSPRYFSSCSPSTRVTYKQRTHTHTHRGNSAEARVLNIAPITSKSQRFAAAPNRMMLPGVVKQSREGINMFCLTTKLRDIYDCVGCTLGKKNIYIYIYVCLCK